MMLNKNSNDSSVYLLKKGSDLFSRLWVSKVMDFYDIVFFVSRVVFDAPRVMLNPLFPVFTPFEKKLLSLIKEQIPNDKAAILDEHIKVINLVYRGGYDREITFFYFHVYKMIWERPCYFEPRKGVNKLLRFKVSFNSDETLNGTLVTEDGVLLGINFGRDADGYRKRTDFTVKVKTHF